MYGSLDRMIEAGLSGVEFYAMNTDMQVLSVSQAPTKLHLGEESTRGLGAGGRPGDGLLPGDHLRRDVVMERRPGMADAVLGAEGREGLGRIQNVHGSVNAPQRVSNFDRPLA